MAADDVAAKLAEARSEILARDQPDEHIMKAVAVALALAEETNTETETDADGALCVAVVRTAVDGDLYFG